MIPSDSFHLGLKKPDQINCYRRAEMQDALVGLPWRQYISAMPRYFFNTRIGETLIPDPEGEELRDPDHAWEVARATIRQILQEEGKEPGLLSASLEVTDEAGEIVLEFPFSEALEIRDEPQSRH